MSRPCRLIYLIHPISTAPPNNHKAAAMQHISPRCLVYGTLCASRLFFSGLDGSFPRAINSGIKPAPMMMIPSNGCIYTPVETTRHLKVAFPELAHLFIKMDLRGTIGDIVFAHRV